ncbi:hypothetical protein ACRARG_05725 [Pseudooceanicola sp. C21-150M6]|uniref:hypothetical protein n=1 Tax=Pseudooceanicola sp. C21-150M6 TaxID=3434355 RepID=UPI003D7FE5B1
MNTRFPIFAATAALILTSTSAMAAGPVSRACIASDRASSSYALCSCLQQVANKTLTRRDQRTVAKIFKEPQLAQDIKMSKTTANDVFWERYQVFGATATKTCSS